MKKLKLLLFILLSILVSCGYQFEGGGYIKNDVTSVAVKMMDNNSSQTSAGITFTNAFIREIQEKTDTIVVDDAGTATFLKGKINAITFATLSRSTTESVLERRATASVDIQLIKNDGEIIWSVKDFTFDEEYQVSEDGVTDESNQKIVVDALASRIAEKLVSRMLNNF
jgi:outer membrane lipopolysaccharide assembly protein LptE/RlpB